MERVARWMPSLVFAVGLVVLVLGAAGGPGWRSGDGVLAAELERTASAPLYGLVATIAAYLPAGEPGFRLAIGNAVLGAALLAGILRAARELLPGDPVAGVVGVIVLALAPAFRDAVGFAGPAVLAACGLVWAFAFALAHAREPHLRRALAALACAAVVLGAAPWLGTLAVAALAAWLWRGGLRDPLVFAGGALGVVIVALWAGAVGHLPPADPSIATVVEAGRGAGAIVVGAGLFGAAFAAATGLPLARWLVAAIALAALEVVVVAPHEPLPLLAVLAVGCAVIPSAIVRAVKSPRRELVALAGGVPLVAAALATGPAFGVDDPGAAPARLASDLTGALPAGPGVFVPRRVVTWSALEYARSVAGARPDLALLPPLPANVAAAHAVNAMRGGQIVASDLPSFDVLDPRLAYPRGRAFQLLLRPPGALAPIPPPARYASQVGAQQAVLLAVDRARYEAAHLRLGAAARAAGLTQRFGAADLAILSTTMPSRPMFFDFLLGLDDLPPGPWLLDLLGDDLAWSAGIDPPAVDAPRPRKLHSLWRALWRGEIQIDDPAIAALGPDAVRATHEVVATFTDKKNRR